MRASSFCTCDLFVNAVAIIHFEEQELGALENVMKNASKAFNIVELRLIQDRRTFLSFFRIMLELEQRKREPSDKNCQMKVLWDTRALIALRSFRIFFFVLLVDFFTLTL